MRPEFHFTAPSGWINDPHGIVFRDGEYHIFYQYVPDSQVWALNCHWGHATSRDLFEFFPLPVAIEPGDGDDGIWTGAVVVDDLGNASAFYTSVAEPDLAMGKVRVASPSDDGWIEWVKGPVVATAPPQLAITDYRDPFVFREGDDWRMFVGAALEDGRATALSYRSADLVEWEYEGIAAERSTRETDPVWTGTLWECPQLFQVDGRSVIVTSVWAEEKSYYAAYGIGTYENGTFRASTWGRLSYGESYYAPSFFRDASGDPTVIFWLREVGDSAAGWTGAHSVPHTLTLDGDTLVATPHSGLDAYRIPAASDRTVVGHAADATWSPGKRLEILTGGALMARLTIEDQNLTLAAGDGQWTMPYSAGPLRLVVDGPVLEISGHCGIMAAAIGGTNGSLEFVGDGAVSVNKLER